MHFIIKLKKNAYVIFIENYDVMFEHIYFDYR